MIVSAFGALHANFLVGPRVPYAHVSRRQHSSPSQVASIAHKSPLGTKVSVPRQLAWKSILRYWFQLKLVRHRCSLHLFARLGVMGQAGFDEDNI
jgi:hypothetical protein